eukprot:1141572-Pelagomonas_calceolata.AAC.4
MFHEVELTRVYTDQLAGMHAKVELASYVQIVRTLRLMVRCLVEGSSRLDVKAKARRLWYSTQVEVRPSPKLSESLRIIAAAVLFQSLSNCKSIGKARNNGCTDNIKRLTWGSIGGVKFIKLIYEVTGHALNLMLPI